MLRDLETPRLKMLPAQPIGTELRRDSGTSSKKVLLAEDEPIIQETLSLILQREGFDVVAVDRGTLAVGAARTWCPDVFLSDVVMPEMNGVEAAIRIGELHPHCRILLMSGQSATTDLLREARLRGHDFDLLVKPVHPSELLSILRSITAEQDEKSHLR